MAGLNRERWSFWPPRSAWLALEIAGFQGEKPTERLADVGILDTRT